jgi:hypothetical protein
LERKVTCLWKEPGVAKSYQSAVSLHGHTNHSRESLYFIVEFAARNAFLRRALAAQERRAKREAAIVIDFWKGFWTPPLPPLAAFQLERDQIESKLGVPGMVSLTDHDNIEAPMLLRVVPEARRIPVSVEWSVPFENATFHLGVHNLPSGRAEFIVEQLQAYTRNPVEKKLPELLHLLNETSDTLVVLNHPLWDLAGIGRPGHLQTLSKFVADLGMFIHAFEISGIRSWEENQLVFQLAEGWNQIAISGGDRHGREPNAVLNLTEAGNFAEFVHQVRKERRSHVLFMPQYTEPVSLRIVQQLLDVIREYPDYSAGSRRWDDRVFHPDQNGIVRPLAALWKRPPAFVELIFSAFRLLEMEPVRRTIQLALTRPEPEIRFAFGDRQGVAS